MLKQVLKGMVIGGAALAMVGTANAATIDVNLYGASAQYKFWTAAAGNFLVSQGCTDVKNAAQSGALDSRDSGWTQGTCGSDTVNIRYTTNASYDGIRAVMADPAYDPDGCGPANRLQPSAATFAAHPASGTVTAHSCQDVHIGASDVAATTFNQESHGQLLGHLGGGYFDSVVKFPNDLGDPEAAGYQVDRPIVVPFGFFGHPGIPVDNVSRLMVTSIYNGQVSNWDQFGFASLPMVVCLRHAGSGTAATLDAAVMRGDFPLAINEIPSTDPLVGLGLAPTIWFNKGSSDEMRCVSGNAGAIGYADVDKCPDTGGTGKCAVKRLDWMGIDTSATGAYTVADAIRNGLYDFWSAQWLYSNEAGATDTWIDALVTFSSVGANIPSGKALYWAAQDDMNWEKATDFSYPKKK